MTQYRLKDVLAGTGGELRGDISFGWQFPNLVRDSRQIHSGDLYIGIRGERFDGNDFVRDAAERGAKAAIVSREWASANDDVSIPLVIVDDTVAALQRWAAWRRDHLDTTVIGVTGSVGKSSAKEAIAAVLEQTQRVYKSPGSFNNEIGLPLSMLEADDDVETMVLEMGGAYAFGELTLLASIAKPQIGVVTNVHPVHLERMGTIEAIAETKTELVQGLPPNGFAILNGDDDRVRAMATRTAATPVYFGCGSGNDIRAENVSTDGPNGTNFLLTIEGERRFVKVPFVGAHGVYVALVALAVGHVRGMRIPEMVTGLSDPAAQIRLLVVPGPSGSDMIDDTYNASPPSMHSALGYLQEIPAKRRIAVLGDMRELGEISEREHRIVGRRAAEFVDLLVTYGAMAASIADEARSARLSSSSDAVLSFQEGQKDEIVILLRDILREGDVVLFKGSRGLEMETFIRDLRADIAESGSTQAGHGVMA